MSIEGMLRHIGRARRAEAKRIMQGRRRTQVRWGQVFNAIGFLAVTIAAVVVLLSM